MAGKVIELQNKLALPDGYQLADSETLRIEAAFASFDGSGAATAFEPCLTFKAPDGRVLNRVRPSTTIAAGGTADVSYAPFPGGIGISSATAIATLGFTAFTPAGNKLLVASNDPDHPTTIITAPSVTFDGVNSVQVVFYASSIDIDGRADGFVAGNASGVSLELYVDGTASGIVANYSTAQGTYFNTTCYIAAFDTPSAGAHVYSLRGWVGKAAGTPSYPVSYVYGTGLSSPHVTRAGYLAMFSIKTS